MHADVMALRDSTVPEFRVRGEMKDSMDVVYPVDVKLDRFKEYRDIDKASGHSRPVDPATRTADALRSVSRNIATIFATWAVSSAQSRSMSRKPERS